MCGCLCLQCAITHRQASFLPTFSRGDTPGPQLKRENGIEEEDGEGKQRGEFASLLSRDGGLTPMVGWLIEWFIYDLFIFTAYRSHGVSLRELRLLPLKSTNQRWVICSLWSYPNRNQLYVDTERPRLPSEQQLTSQRVAPFRALKACSDFNYCRKTYIGVSTVRSLTKCRQIYRKLLEAPWLQWIMSVCTPEL